MSKNIWISSDHHLGHDNIYKFLGDDGLRIRREFDTRAQGEEAMIERHNAVVRPGDTWYCLGDIVLDKSLWALDKVCCFNGHRRIVLGNHDPRDVNLLLKAGFEKVYGTRKLYDIIVSHFPVHPGSIPHWSLGNAHGHIHRQPSPPGPYFNCCVEVLDYTPIHIEDLQARLRRMKEARDEQKETEATPPVQR